MHSITLLMLASGTATRLMPAIRHGEKHILSINNVPLMVRSYITLSKIVNAKIDLVAVVRRENRDLYELKLNKYIAREKLHIVENPLADTTNNSYTLLLGLKYVNENGLPKDIIIMNGDIVLLKPMRRNHQENLPNVTSALISYNYDKSHFMRVYVSNGYVRYMGFDIPPNLVSAVLLGIYVPSNEFHNFHKML